MTKTIISLYICNINHVLNMFFVHKNLSYKIREKNNFTSRKNPYFPVIHFLTTNKQDNLTKMVEYNRIEKCLVNLNE